MPQAIIDSHVHFWDRNLRPYPWLENVPTIAGPALPIHLLEQAQGVDLQGVVFVQAGAEAGYGLDEAKWVSSLAEDEPKIRAIVAFAPLELGEGARQHLDALAELPLVKGIRRIIQSEAVDFCTQSDFIHGVQLLADYGFTFDICIHHRQMQAAIQLVDACPNVRFVLDHFGKPRVRDQVLDPWREDLRQLASYENLWCKLSGLATEADHAQWTREQLRPYIDYALETFAPDRVMFGGDWPVCRLALEYQEWIDVMLWATSALSEENRQKMLYTNAEAFYGMSY